MTPRRKVLALSLALVVALAAAAITLSHADPILLRFGARGFEPNWSLLNPMRNRGPERAAVVLLEKLRAGNARSILPGVVRDLPIPPEVFAHETQDFPIRSWRLVNRKDGPEVVKLVYRVKRANYQDIGALVWIEVKGTARESKWTVVDYTAEY